MRGIGSSALFFSQIIRWSATLERFGGAPGPLHTKSKRVASLKNNADKIAAMLAEIGDYEELSSNRDRADDWQTDAGEAMLWMQDYWRVIEASEALETSTPGCSPSGTTTRTTGLRWE